MLWILWLVAFVVLLVLMACASQGEPWIVEYVKSQKNRGKHVRK